MPIIPSHRAAGQSANGNEGDGGWGTGARAPRRATSNGPEATRISGSIFQIWNSGFPPAWAQQETRSRLEFASAREGGRNGRRHKRHWVSTEELTLWQRHCLGKSSFDSRVQTMGVAVNSPEAPIQTQWASSTRQNELEDKPRFLAARIAVVCKCKPAGNVGCNGGTSQRK